MDPAPRVQKLWPRVTLVAIVVLVLGVFLGGHPGWMPNWIRSAFAPQTSAQKEVSQVLGLIQKDYYRPVNTDTLANDGLVAAVKALGDPYSHYFPASQQQQFQEETNPTDDGGIGIDVSSDPHGLLISDVFPDSPASSAGLHPGEVITAVGSKRIGGELWTKAADLIRGRVGTTVLLTIESKNHSRQVSVKRANITVPVATSQIVTYKGVRIGYLLYTQFTQGSAAELRRQVKKMLADHAQALILDLRDNPGGLLNQAVAVASLFIPNGTIVTTRGRSQPTTVYTAAGDAIAPSIPMAVLVDRGTASSGEIVTAALQERGRAKIVGTRTYGKGVFQESQTVDGGGTLDITVGQFYTPNGTNLGAPSVKNGKSIARGPGIKPNLYVYDNPDDPGPAALRAAEKLLAGEVR